MGILQEPRNLSWNQFNESRRFPLLYDCSATSVDGHFRIPDDLITGLYISHQLDKRFPSAGSFYIRSFINFRTGFSFTLYYKQDGGNSEGIKIAQTTVELTSAYRAQIISFSGVDTDFFNGFFILGEITGLEQQPVGEWQFEPSATLIDPFCVHQTAVPIFSVYVEKLSGEFLGPFYDEVILAEGKKIKLDVREIDEFNCPDGSGEVPATEIVIATDDELDEEVPAIKTINGVFPDPAGNIEFIGTDCLKIEPEGASTLLFDDKCAEPCCGCTELTPVEEKIKEIDTSIIALATRIEAMDAQIQMMQYSFNSAKP